MASKPFNPFLFYSDQLQRLFVKASKQDNPAWWLYQNGARTSLFMLEALTKLHDEAFGEKVFKKWNPRFKKLEDLFGIIDYYSAFETEFKKNKKISPSLLSYFSENKLQYIEICNKRLKKKSSLNNKLLSFNEKLAGYNAMYSEDYVDTLRQSISNEISDIKTFCADRNYSLTLFEEEVHEVRRKLRWLSIYHQSFNGLIQLKKSSTKTIYSISYFTKNTLSSPFNQRIPKPKNSAILEYNDKPFLALSWIINELGILKDSGLKIQALTDAFCYTEELTEHQAKEKTFKLLGLTNTTEKELLKKASVMTHTFIAKDKVLDSLLAATNTDRTGSLTKL